MKRRASHIYAGIPAGSFIKAKAEIHSYQEAADFLGDESERELASNVRVLRLPKALDGALCIGIQLYNTIVLRYYSDGTFVADNGGHNTPTTRTRVAQFGPKGWNWWHKKKQLHGYHQSSQREIPFPGRVCATSGDTVAGADTW